MNNFKILEGKPEIVEQDVVNLLQQGWSLHGPLVNRTVDSTNIVAQAMTKMDRPSVFTFRIISNHAFDPTAFVNLVHHHQTKMHRATEYIVKIKGYSQNEIENQIRIDIDVQQEQYNDLVCKKQIDFLHKQDMI